VLAAGAVSARVVYLAERMVSSMVLTKRTLIAATALALGICATGAALMAAPGPAAPESTPVSLRPAAPADSAALLLTPGDAARHALAVARSLPEPAERAEALLRLGRAATRRGEAAAAKTTLRLAVQAALSIPANARYTFPHPIIRIAAAQAELGNEEAARRTFRAAAQVIGAEDDQHQGQNWNNLVHYQLRTLGRVSAETVAGYRQYVGRGQNQSLYYVIPLLLRLQAASGDAKGALRAVAEGAEFAGSQGASLRKVALLAIVGGVMRDDPAVTEVLVEAKKAVADHPGPTPGRSARTRDLLTLAKAEARLARLTDAVATAGMMKMIDVHDKFNTAQTFAEIAMEQARAGDKAGAVASARRTIAIIDTVQEETYKTYPLFQAGEALVAAGALGEARKLAETIMPDFRSLLLVRIADARRAACDEATALDDLKQALRAREEYRAWTIQRPAPADGQPDTRNQAIASATLELARLQARLGDLPAALGTVATIPDAKGREDALIVLAAARAGEGDLGSAGDLVARIESPAARGKAWISIACALPAPKVNKPGPSAVPGRQR
jgi:hypothetical protein